MLGRMVKDVRVIEESDEIIDFIQDNFPDEIRDYAFAEMGKSTDRDVLIPFYKKVEGQYGIIMRFVAHPDDGEGGSALVLIAREKDSLYKYLETVRENSPDFTEYINLQIEHLQTNFADIEKRVNDEP